MLEVTKQGTKMKGGKKVPNCVKEFSEWKISEKVAGSPAEVMPELDDRWDEVGSGKRCLSSKTKVRRQSQ